jgi:hypothetical protein
MNTFRNSRQAARKVFGEVLIAVLAALMVYVAIRIGLV